MSIQMQLWRIEGERPGRLRSAKLDLENRLETWICEDLGLVGEDLLLLDRQVATDYGHWIDVLALDRGGNLVILELKRGRTPRDVVAQILDYASWVHGLTRQDVERLAEAGRKLPLEELFRKRFGSELPESLNEEQRLVIVATELDPQSERIVQFLSSRHGVNINVVFFDYYRDGDREYVGRSWLIAPSEVKRSVRMFGSGKRALLTIEDLVGLADERGVGDLYRALYEGLRPLCDQVGTTQSNVSFRWRSAETGSRALVSVYPNASDSERGLMADIRVEDLARQFRLAIVDLRGALPTRLPSESVPVYLYAEGYGFQNCEQIDRFVAKLSAAAPGAVEPG